MPDVEAKKFTGKDGTTLIRVYAETESSPAKALVKGGWYDARQLEALSHATANAAFLMDYGQLPEQERNQA